MKKRCGVHALRIAVGIMMLALLLASSSNAATITVNASGSEDYSRIQDAIDNARAGDTILVYSGIYYENVIVNKQIILRGIGNPVVDAAGSGSAITLSVNRITLEGFTATGSSGWKEAGINITSSNNTLIGNNASNNYNDAIGISLSDSSNNMLTGNNASNNHGSFGSYGSGISLSDSSNNTLTGNKASNNYATGISLFSSSNNTLTGNKASNNGNADEGYDYGIFLSSSSNNTLIGNNASNNYAIGISLSSSSNNTLISNNASNKGDPCESGGSGIFLSSSSNNTLTGNNALNNYGSNYGIGISLSSSNNNTLNGNMMSGNPENFNLNGYTYSDFDNQIDTTNLVDGKPVYFIKGAIDIVYDSSTNAGTFYCISCVNVTLINLDMNKNGNGIYFWNTSQSRIQNVNASNNRHGIFLSDSSNNTLNGNKASNNWGGISLSGSSNNTIYNNIFNNTKNFEIHKSKINKWNTKKQSGTNIIGGPILGGNFWANPEGTGFSKTCKDMNSNGICEKRYILNENNIDYLPLSMNFTKDTRPPKSVRNPRVMK